MEKISWRLSLFTITDYCWLTIIYNEIDATCNLAIFIDILNNMDPNISFTLDKRTHCISFMDVIITNVILQFFPYEPY